MKKIQMVLLVLMAAIFSSCTILKETLTYEKMNRIQRGMSTEEVIVILGNPYSRSFNDQGEILEFRDEMYERDKVVRINFVDDKVVQMESFVDKKYSFPTPADSPKEKKKEDSAKDITSGIRVSPDGKHYVRAGSIVITPDGRHETIVSEHGSVMVTASGQHINVP